MATGTTNSTSLANVIPTVLQAARDYVEKPTIMNNKRVVTMVTLGDGDGSTYNWPKFANKFTAQALVEGSPINNAQTLVPDSAQFTTSEYGVMFLITDKAKRVTKEPMWARGGRFCGNAMRRYKEVQGLALFSGLSRDLGAANNPFSPSFVGVAKVRLRAASEATQTEPVPDGRVIGVLHDFHKHDFLAYSGVLGNNVANGLTADDSTLGYAPIEGWTKEMVMEYDIRRYQGVDLLSSSLMSIDGSDDAVAAIFNPGAFIHVRTSHSMRSEQDRDITLRAEMLVMTAEDGWGELEDQFGFAVTADATAPTS